MTLIEVVAALALLATLLVAVLAASDRFGRQNRRAQKRLLAIEAADMLLSEWTATDLIAIDKADGETEDPAHFYWSVDSRSESSLEELGIQVAKLRIYENRPIGAEVPLVVVEFLTASAINGRYP